MKRLPPGALAIVTVMGISWAVLALNQDDVATRNEIAAHRQWKRVNPDPVEVPVPVTKAEGTVVLNPAALS